MAFEAQLQELNTRLAKALLMGGEERLAARRSQGVLNARERIEYLLDPGSFLESGILATSHRPEARDKTPADGKLIGSGTICGRPVAVISNDFTVMGASRSVVNGKKIKHTKQLANESGMPLILLAESAGARMTDRMGAAGRAILGQDPTEYLRDRRTPWVSALLGSCYGSSTWYGCLSDFVVMRKGATMAVASSRVTALAINQPVDAEELGGWKLHTDPTGLVDVAVGVEVQAVRCREHLAPAKQDLQRLGTGYPGADFTCHGRRRPPLVDQVHRRRIDQIGLMQHGRCQSHQKAQQLLVRRAAFQPEILFECHVTRQERQHRSTHAQRCRGNRRNAVFGAQGEQLGADIEYEKIQPVDIQIHP